MREMREQREPREFREQREPRETTSYRRSRKRACRFCADHEIFLDYKEPKVLFPFVSDRGKIVPRRITGNCAYHQRRIQEAIKRARILALLPCNTVYIA